MPEKRGLTGWHFSPDKAGLDSTITLVELLGAATYPVKRTLRLTRPSEQTASSPFASLNGRKVIAPKSLQLSADGTRPADLWQVEEEGGRVRLRLGPKALMELLDGLRELQQRGYGDLSVGPTQGERPQNIWLW